VRPTLEVTVVETPKHLHRRKRPEFGIALIDLG
jgi:predicted DNA-binding protein with PD1-like motif